MAKSPPPAGDNRIRTCRILTDGKAGDLVQCLGLAQALGLEADIRTIVPRRLFALFMPFGPIDPRDGPKCPGSPVGPPFPDLAIASGRRSAAYLRALKKASQGRTFTVFLKDPRIGAKAADFIWVPGHDRLRGDNVMVTLTSPHGISPLRLAAARKAPPDFIGRASRPRVAILLGGDSAHYRFDEDANRRLGEALAQIRASHPSASFLVTPSRRTPEATLQLVRQALAGANCFIWDGGGENPYVALLANADFLIVTADSANMVSEALCAGVPVYVFEPAGGSPKFTRFLSALKAQGLVRILAGDLQPFECAPVDATPQIADEIARRFAARRRLA